MMQPKNKQTHQQQERFFVLMSSKKYVMCIKKKKNEALTRILLFRLNQKKAVTYFLLRAQNYARMI